MLKIYYKFLRKIQNNKARIIKIISISTLTLKLRYSETNSIPTYLESNYTHQVEQTHNPVHNYVEEDMQVVDTSGKRNLSNKSSSNLIKTGSLAVIEVKTSVPPSKTLKSTLGIRSGNIEGVEASTVDGFTPPLPQRQGDRTTNGIGGSNPGNGSGGSSSAPSSGNLDGNCPSNPTPKFPYELSVNNRNQNKNKKNSIEVKIVNGEIVVRITRDDMPFFIDEMTARKKIYHAPDFEVALPDNLDLEYVKSLSTKDRLKYLSDPGILPQKCVGEYMKKLGQHLLDPTTEIKVGTLGGNGATKGWNEPVPGTHAFNPGTGNDLFFADEGFKFHTGMNLNDGQRIDLEDNNNIL